MKQILLLVGQSLMQQFLRAPDHGQGHSIGPALLEPAKEYVAETVRKYALTTALAFVFSLYFVAGTLIMITAAASSFDAFGFFSPGTFFYSGVAVTIISIAVLGGCYASLLKGRDKKMEAKVVAPEPALPAPVLPFGHVAEAVIAGIISGLVSRRLSRPSPSSIRSIRERLRRVV